MVDAIFLMTDIATFMAEPTIENAGWIAISAVCIVDPTGITSTSVHIRKTLKIAEESIGIVKSLNGNSKLCKRLQHGYEIFEEATGKVAKTGISGGVLNKNGTSRRANGQVNKLNKAAGYNKYSARVVVKNIEGRSRILKWEKMNANRLRNLGHPMNEHQKP